MKKTKSIIIVLLILVVLIIIAMLIISLSDKGKNKWNNTVTNSISNEAINNVISEEEELKNEERIDAPDERVTAKSVTILTNHSTFFSIEKLMTRYFLYLRAGNNEAVYDIIEDSYKDENEINEQNVIETLRINTYEGNYTAKEIYERKDNYKPIYFISGTLEKNGTRTPCYFIMKQDKENISFKLKPITEEEYKMYLNERKTETFEEDIELNKYNKIVNVTLTEEEIARKYFNSYIQNARYNPEEAYDSLNEEYRDARFGSYDKFREYLEEENKAKQLESFDSKAIKDLEDFETKDEYEEYMINLNHKYIEKYFHYTENDKEYYICIDYYNNYYIFEIYGVMNYELYLDTYTVGLNYFTKQYEDEEVTIEEKGQIVVNRILEALNNKDYEYVYNKLDNATKKTYKSYDEFAETMKNNLFDNNQIELDDYSEDDNDKCSYELIVTDSEGKDIKDLTMSIEVQLQEKDFVISRMILKY